MIGHTRNIVSIALLGQLGIIYLYPRNVLFLGCRMTVHLQETVTYWSGFILTCILLVSLKLSHGCLCKIVDIIYSLCPRLPVICFTIIFIVLQRLQNWSLPGLRFVVPHWIFKCLSFWSHFFMTSCSSKMLYGLVELNINFPCQNPPYPSHLLDFLLYQRTCNLIL